MTSIRSLVFGFFLLTFLLSAVSGQISESPKTYRAYRLAPSDEGKNDPSFHAFRQKLLEAISRKDAKFLLSIVDPNIQISFGGEEGIRAFREVWKPDDVNSEVWDTLAQLLRLSGTFGESFRRRFTRTAKQGGPCLDLHSSSRRSRGFR